MWLWLTTIRRISSGTLRLALQMAYAEEWENITGAWNWQCFFPILQCSFSTWETERASLAVWTEVWERSTIMPSLFISCTTVCNGNICIPPLYPACSILSTYWSLLDIWFIQKLDVLKIRNYCYSYSQFRAMRWQLPNRQIYFFCKFWCE